MSQNLSFLQPIRGTKDVLGTEMDLFNYIVECASQLAFEHHFVEIATPIFEYSEVFFRNLGESSDIITKETYTFSDREKRSITLRPEFTAGIARAVISNDLQQKLPQHLFSSGPVFRHERPQRGRQRQFHQLNYEIVGANSIHDDVAIIKLARDLLENLGLSGQYSLELNSLGCQKSRADYREALVEYFSKYENDLSEDSKNRLNTNPLRILDSKDDGDKKLIVDAPTMRKYFTKESLKMWEDLQIYLQALEIPYKINEKLVRGLDYYTHTVFEFTTESLGAQGTILAGGRYDGLYSQISDNKWDIPAIGFAAGIERLIELMKLSGFDLGRRHAIAIMPIEESVELALYINKLADFFRLHGLPTYIDYNGKLAKRLKKSESRHASIALIIGPEEMQSNVLKVKDMVNSQEFTVNSQDELLEKIHQIWGVESI